MQKGFTLIEVIIYIALFAFIIGTGVSAAYYIIESSAKGEAKTDTIAEGEFLMRKIDWALTGANDVDATTQTITKGGSIVFDTDSSRVRITISGNREYLTSENVEVTDLQFVSIPASPPRPEGVTINSTIDGRHFEITKYLRQ